MTLETFIRLAEKYNDLGGAVQEQLRDVLDDRSTMAEQNPNALREIRDRLLRNMISCDDEELAGEARDLRDNIDHHIEGRRRR